MGCGVLGTVALGLQGFWGFRVSGYLPGFRAQG